MRAQHMGCMLVYSPDLLSVVGGLPPPHHPPPQTPVCPSCHLQTPGCLLDPHPTLHHPRPQDVSLIPLPPPTVKGYFTSTLPPPTVKGYAWSGGGNGITRVDVTTDNGKTWFPATLKSVPQHTARRWSWSLWEVEVPVPKGLPQGSVFTLAAKATDDAHNTQPEGVEGVWNLRGLNNNAWHRIEVTVRDD